MALSITISGSIVTGAGKAAAFTQLPWVQAQCREKLHFIPYPGTLNIETDQAKTPTIDWLQHRCAAIRLIPPDPQFCEARVVPADLEGIRAAIIVPAPSVRIHDRHTLEIIAPVGLRQALKLGDGATVRLVIRIGADQ